jgi:hypothetical protein
MFSGIYNQFVDYVEDYPKDLPKNMRQAAFQSAVYSFAISSIISNHVRVGIVSAAFAATVSLISSLTMPFFRKAFADRHGYLTWDKQVVSMAINIALSQFLIHALTAHRIDSFTAAFFTIGLHLFFNGFNDQSTRESCPYIFV